MYIDYLINPAQHKLTTFANANNDAMWCDVMCNDAHNIHSNKQLLCDRIQYVCIQYENRFASMQ